LGKSRRVARPIRKKPHPGPWPITSGEWPTPPYEPLTLNQYLDRLTSTTNGRGPVGWSGGVPGTNGDVGVVPAGQGPEQVIPTMTAAPTVNVDGNGFPLGLIESLASQRKSPYRYVR